MAETTVVLKLETDVVLVVKKLKAGIEDAGDDAVKVAAFVQANSTEILQLASLAGPQAASVAQVGLTLTNLAITAVKNTSSAASANGVSVSLDQNALAAVKALIADIEKI